VGPLSKYPRCSVCNRVAEVSHPDGYGDQTYYCAEHEPETLLTGLTEEED
jgi:hypothetical protein